LITVVNLSVMVALETT